MDLEPGNLKNGFLSRKTILSTKSNYSKVWFLSANCDVNFQECSGGPDTNTQTTVFQKIYRRCAFHALNAPNL